LILTVNLAVEGKELDIHEHALLRASMTCPQFLKAKGNKALDTNTYLPSCSERGIDGGVL